MREDQYDYIINKPELNEDTLAHYGVKGMKWRRRKGSTVAGSGDKIEKIRRLKDGSPSSISSKGQLNIYAGKERLYDPNKRNKNGQSLSSWKQSYYLNDPTNKGIKAGRERYAQKKNSEAAVERTIENMRKKKRNAMHGDKRY